MAKSNKSLKNKRLAIIMALLIALIAGGIIFLNYQSIRSKIVSKEPIVLKDNTLVAIVDDEKLYYSDLSKYVDVMLKSEGVTINDIPDKGVFRMNCLTAYATEVVVNHLANKEGITISDEEFNKEYEDLMEAYNGEDKFKDYLNYVGADEEFFKKTFKTQLLEDKIGKLAGDANPTDDELKEFFEKYKDYYTFDGVDLALIACETEEAAKECKSKYDEGTPFAELFTSYNKSELFESEDGQVGLIAKEHFLDEVVEKIWSLDPKGMTEPIELDGGWNLFVANEFIWASDKGFDDFKEEVKEDYQYDFEYSYYNKFLEEHKANDMIEYKVTEADLAN